MSKRYCPNGHDITNMVNYCTICGKKILKKGEKIKAFDVKDEEIVWVISSDYGVVKLLATNEYEDGMDYFGREKIKLRIFISKTNSRWQLTKNRTCFTTEDEAYLNYNNSTNIDYYLTW